ncbi:S1C family serine protease [Metabacillus halosaccharovorans]|uniref:Trypsin-like peptidase domain-containing protein n=1 Tax=Metabacillus halosaccharovorans TaxID=930124 RepID=A0ABT3DIU5_9BACI|nr:trypsin-like peptidase domain-containing protein [Metabacillus halosaccharovorans]MCV9886793.1 trypsin-like peptidase domain-containing protein [Metabacillus halosaccharovorans]
MGYYDETEITREHKKPRRSFKPVLSSIISGVVGGALVLGVTTFTNDQQPSVTETNQAVETAAQNESSTSTANTQALSTGSNSIADIVDSLSPAIVGITNLQTQKTGDIFQNSTGESVESGTGSGVIFKKEGDAGYIITNNHVIEGAQSIEVTLYSGDKVEAELVGTDALTDIAVLKINAEHVEVVAEMGDSSELRTGEDVIAIGNPLGEEFTRTVTQGIISGVDRTIDVTTSEGNWALDVLQTDAAINPGNSGGPLINMSGQVIGINSLKITESGVEGLGFAIPSNDVLPIAEELMNNGKIQRPFLGVGLVEMSEIPQYYLQEQMNLPDDVKEGVVVGTVSPNSPADEAGLQQQDVIVSMNDQAITNASDLRKFLYTETEIGDEVDVTLYRAGKKVTVKIKLTTSEATNA